MVNKIKKIVIKMKRSIDIEGNEIGLMDLPRDLQAEILLIRFKFEIKSTHQWHKIQKLFRMIPLFGKTEVRPTFYAKIRRFTPDLFEIFFKTVEYPLFCGLNEFSPTCFTEKFYLDSLLPFLKNLQTLDLSRYLEKIEIAQFTSLTNLHCGYNTTADDLENLFILKTLQLGPRGYSDRLFSKLTNLTNLDLGEGFTRNRDRTSFSTEIFRGLSNLQSLRIDTTNQWNQLEIRMDIETIEFDLMHLTSLDLYGNCTNLPEILQTLSNLHTLCLHQSSGLMGRDMCSKMTNITNLSLTNCYFPESLERITGLVNLRTLLRKDRLSDSDYANLPNLTALSLLTSDSYSRNTKYLCRDADNLTNLLSLQLRSNFSADKTISKLVNLTHLDVIGNSEITDRSLHNLTNLKRLDICSRVELSRNAMNRLPSLETVGILKKDLIFLEIKIRSLDRSNIQIKKVY